MTSGDAVLLAISTDSVETQCKFAESLATPFRLLSDSDAKVAEAYGVRFEMRGMTLAARALFVVDRRGKLALVDRSFGVPETLAKTALPGALAKLVDHDLEEGVGKTRPFREETLAALRTLDEVCRRDWDALRARLDPAAPQDAADLLGPLATLDDPWPAVFDLVDPAGTTVAADKVGIVEVSAPSRLERFTRIAVTLKKADAGWRVLAVRAEER